MKICNSLLVQKKNNDESRVYQIKKKGQKIMANPLDEVNGPIAEQGRDVNVIQK